MPEELIDWDEVYREQGFFEGPPPWNIGEPQREIAELIRAGRFRSDVLDARCGFCGGIFGPRGARAHRRGYRPDADRGCGCEESGAGACGREPRRLRSRRAPRRGTGASLFVPVFATGAFPTDTDLPVPNVVNEAALREAVSKYWMIDEIRPAFIRANMPMLPDAPSSKFDTDEKGRQKMPAFLLIAHKAS